MRLTRHGRAVYVKGFFFPVVPRGQSRIRVQPAAISLRTYLDVTPARRCRRRALRVLNHQSVFLAFQRADGALVDSGAVKYLRTA
jgi:hypothetical protein